MDHSGLHRRQRILLTATVAAIAAACVALKSEQPVAATAPPDVRVPKLRRFFDAHDCPRPYHAAEYIRAADEYGVDYRILPAISVLESGCGDTARFHNRWGWNAGRARFRSVDQGIDYVTRQLATEKPFEGRGLDAKLFAYNHRRPYVRAAKRLMREIQEAGPAPDAPEAARPDPATSSR